MGTQYIALRIPLCPLGESLPELGGFKDLLAGRPRPLGRSFPIQPVRIVDDREARSDSAGTLTGDLTRDFGAPGSGVGSDFMHQAERESLGRTDDTSRERELG